MAKVRLDVALVEKGLVKSREKAKALIMAGQVLVDNKKIDKAGTEIDPQLEIRILGNDLPYVSRGGLKLEKAIQAFELDFQGKVVADIGASTGGFVDCALQHGARKVYAIDVGYNQLDWKLRSDERVVNMEKTNARYLVPQDLGEAVDFVTTDVAFISLDKILPPAVALLAQDGQIAALIKPQFEAGREYVGKKGVVRDPIVHQQVIHKILTLCAELGLAVNGLTYSPIKGPEGNIEYLLWASKHLPQVALDVAQVVACAHSALDKH